MIHLHWREKIVVRVTLPSDPLYSSPQISTGLLPIRFLNNGLEAIFCFKEHKVKQLIHFFQEPSALPPCFLCQTPCYCTQGLVREQFGHLHDGMPTPCSNAQKIHPASGHRTQITTQQELPLRRLAPKWPINPHIVKTGRLPHFLITREMYAECHRCLQGWKEEEGIHCHN